MKAKRLLFLVMAIGLASGVKAQFYDGPDNIYYYVKYENGEYKYNDVAAVFNFDGKKAFNLSHGTRDVSEIKQNLLKNPNYYEDLLETSDYNLFFIESNSSGIIYSKDEHSTKWIFSKDRIFLTTRQELGSVNGRPVILEFQYKKVDKSFFKVGRSKTPSGTMYE